MVIKLIEFNKYFLYVNKDTDHDNQEWEFSACSIKCSILTSFISLIPIYVSSFAK